MYICIYISYIKYKSHLLHMRLLFVDSHFLWEQSGLLCSTYKVATTIKLKPTWHGPTLYRNDSWCLCARRTLVEHLMSLYDNAIEQLRMNNQGSFHLHFSCQFHSAELIRNNHLYLHAHTRCHPHIGRMWNLDGNVVQDVVRRREY